MPLSVPSCHELLSPPSPSQSLPLQPSRVPPTHIVLCLYVCAGLDQHLDHCHMALVGGPVERRRLGLREHRGTCGVRATLSLNPCRFPHTMHRYAPLSNSLFAPAPLPPSLLTEHFVSMSAPALINALTIATWPSWAAQWSGVDLDCGSIVKHAE